MSTSDGELFGFSIGLLSQEEFGAGALPLHGGPEAA